MIGQQVPYTISQNVSFATNPTRLQHCAHDRRSVSGDRPGQAAHHRGAAGGQPARARAFLRERNALRRAVAPRHRSPAVRRDGARARPTRAAPASTSCSATTRTRCSPGSASQESRRLIQPLNRLNNMLQCDPRNRSNYHSGQLKVTQRFSNGLQFLGSYTYGKSLDYGGSAASGGGAVGNPQTVTNLGRGTRSIGVRRAPSRRGQLGLRAAVGTRPALDARGRHARRNRRRLAACRHRDDDDGPAVHGVHADRREQRRAELAEPDRIRGAGQPDA